MSVHDVDDLNIGYAQGLLEEYLENPEAVPAEWREFFESGDPRLAETLPGLARLLETLRDGGDGAPTTPEAAPPPATGRPPDPGKGVDPELGKGHAADVVDEEGKPLPPGPAIEDA